MNPARPLRLSLVALLVVFPVGFALAEEPPSGESFPDDCLLVLVEVWRAGDLSLVSEIEAMTERDPGNLAAVRKRLVTAGDAAERLSRFLTPTTDGEPVQHADVRKVAVQVSTPTGGAVRGGFGGFLEVGTELELQAQLRDRDLVEVLLQLETKGADEPPAGGSSVPDQFVAKIQGNLTAPLGTFRMFQSNVRGSDTIYVFVRVTSPGAAAPSSAVAPGPTLAEGEEPSFGEAEIRWFQALKRVADERDRAERTRTMIERQVSRLDLELTTEQMTQVIELTTAYRDRVREALRSEEAASGSREERQAVLAAVRNEYEAAIRELLPEADAEKVVGGLGRFPGFGRRGGPGGGR